MSNVSGRDLGSFVKDSEQAVTSGLQLPPGYHLEWGGQYENQRRAEQRLAIVLPVSILIISALLYATFQNTKQMLLILSIVPLALVGGIAALWIRGINLNLSASVGFIALFGIAVLNGVRHGLAHQLPPQRRQAHGRGRPPGRLRPPPPRPHHRPRRLPRLHPHGARHLPPAPRSSAPSPPSSSADSSPPPSSPCTSSPSSTLASAKTSPTKTTQGRPPSKNPA